MFPFVYRRGQMYCAVNPSPEEITVQIEELGNRKVIFTIGKAFADEGKLIIGPQSFAVIC